MPIFGPRTKRVVVIGSLALALAGVSLAVSIFVGPFGTRETSTTTSRDKKPAPTGIGSARALQASYQRWKAQYVSTEGDRMLVLPLGYSKGLSARFTSAQGHVRLDLANGTISVEVSGLPAGEAFEVWLVDNRPGPGRSVRPEAGDNLMRAGRLERAGDALAMRAQLGRELLTGFELDLVVVAPAGGDPGADGLLFGAPSLFHRLYYREQRATVAAAGGATGTVWAPFSALVPRPAWAQASGAADLQAQVERGRRLFFEETFKGNGRTCGSCHDAQNNLTIDPEFIAKLPPNDPLFVAEFNPDLAELENPALMREFGLILENVDGFERPGVMRGVPHVLAMPTSVASSQGPRTGWSGDGAPGDGSLRLFAIGAIKQHFPKTLHRVEGVDFVLPTTEQLDDMEAFQLSLGRQADLVLSAMLFRNATVEQGKQLFLDPAVRCNACHANAGANASFGGGNRNFNTGVEELVPESERASRPRDGGLGKEEEKRPDGTPTGGFGSGTFNTPVLVEAADTGPLFHNNTVKTIEDAVAFYTSDIFFASPSGLPRIVLTSEQVNAIAAFLRVINALENIRSATAAQTEARDADFTEARSQLGFSITEIDDAIKVLNERGLHGDAVRHLHLARALATAASRVPLPTLRSLLIGLTIAQQDAARALLVMIVPQ